MTALHSAGPIGALPRVVTESLLWTGGCLELPYKDDFLHGHYNTYLIKGREKTMLVDTGLPAHRADIEPGIEEFLDGRTIDYIFPTHAEFPHMGLLAHWMHRYPNAIAVGDLRDYRLYYPELAHRFQVINAGDHINMGDRKIIFLPAIWRDLNSTLWAFDTTDRVLYVSDGFAYLHYHRRGQCDMLTSEQPSPDVDLMRLYNEYALPWTKYVDVQRTFGDLDAMFDAIQPKYIAPAHSCLIDTKEDLIPLAKIGLALNHG